jgi:hypothetical protein
MAFSGAGSVVGALAVAWLGKYKRMGLTVLILFRLQLPSSLRSAQIETLRIQLFGLIPQFPAMETMEVRLHPCLRITLTCIHM